MTMTTDKRRQRIANTTVRTTSKVNSMWSGGVVDKGGVVVVVVVVFVL